MTEKKEGFVSGSEKMRDKCIEEVKKLQKDAKCINQARMLIRAIKAIESAEVEQ